MNKKVYETPLAELYKLRITEEVLSRPSVSEGGFGFDDEGPGARRDDDR